MKMTKVIVPQMKGPGSEHLGDGGAEGRLRLLIEHMYLLIKQNELFLDIRCL